MLTFKQYLLEDIYRSDVKHIQDTVDNVLPQMGFDSLRISGHLLDRANEVDRNAGKPITTQELIDLLLKQAKINGKNLSRLRDMDQVTLKDGKSKIYVGIQKDYQTLVLKTIIRKEGMFKTSDRILMVM